MYFGDILLAGAFILLGVVPWFFGVAMITMVVLFVPLKLVRWWRRLRRLKN